MFTSFRSCRLKNVLFTIAASLDFVSSVRLAMDDIPEQSEPAAVEITLRKESQLLYKSLQDVTKMRLAGVLVGKFQDLVAAIGVRQTENFFAACVGTQMDIPPCPEGSLCGFSRVSLKPQSEDKFGYRPTCQDGFGDLNLFIDDVHVMSNAQIDAVQSVPPLVQGAGAALKLFDICMYVCMFVLCLMELNSANDIWCVIIIASPLIMKLTQWLAAITVERRYFEQIEDAMMGCFMFVMRATDKFVDGVGSAVVIVAQRLYWILLTILILLTDALRLSWVLLTSYLVVLFLAFCLTMRGLLSALLE